jgi:hypothetical protein
MADHRYARAASDRLCTGALWRRTHQGNVTTRVWGTPTLIALKVKARVPILLGQLCALHPVYAASFLTIWPKFDGRFCCVGRIACK